MARQFRAATGINEKEFQTFYDSRPLSTKTFHFLSHRRNSAVIIAALTAVTIAFPAMMLLLFLVSLIVCSIPLSHKQRLPMRIPIKEKVWSKKKKKYIPVIDPNDAMPGTARMGFRAATGSFLLGYDSKTGEQIWAGTDDILRHILLLGVTGAGKTEALLGLLSNVVAMGGGTIYADAKGTIKLYWQITSIATLMGREDDMFLANYITGGLSPTTMQEIGRVSNTAMPFAIGAADGILQTLVSLMPEGGGGNEVFRERAIAIMSALLGGLVDLRTRYGRPLSPGSIRQFLDMNYFKDLIDGKYGELTKKSKTGIHEYLSKLPGWVEGVPIEEQGEQVHNQFGFAQMYWTRALGQLADSFDHIYGDSHGEIDYADILLNRRIFCILLPAMEKAIDELGQLGKINLAALKSVMALGLGMRVEGSRAEVLDALPSAQSVPSLLILDEYGYMAAKGFAVAAAQARGLGIGAIFAGQGLIGFKALQGNEGSIEVGQIIDNTRMKIAMSIEDADESMKLFREIAGKATVSRESSWEMNELGNATASRSASLNEEDRINVSDIREQIEGESHLFWRGKIIRFDFFHADPQLPSKSKQKLNTGIAIRLEQPADVLGAVNRIVDKDSNEYGRLIESLGKGDDSEDSSKNPKEIDLKKVLNGQADIIDNTDHGTKDTNSLKEVIISNNEKTPSLLSKALDRKKKDMTETNVAAVENLYDDYSGEKSVIKDEEALSFLREKTESSRTISSRSDMENRLADIAKIDTSCDKNNSLPLGLTNDTSNELLEDAESIEVLEDNYINNAKKIITSTSDEAEDEISDILGGLKGLLNKED